MPYLRRIINDAFRKTELNSRWKWQRCNNFGRCGKIYLAPPDDPGICEQCHRIKAAGGEGEVKG